MAGAVNVQVTIDAKDNGAAAQLLALKQAAGQLGVAFNVATASSAKLGASGKGLGRDFSGAFAGAIEGATGLRTVLAQVAIGYEAIHAARAFLTEGFTATSGLEQARLGIGAEVAASSTITDPSGKAIEGQEKLALATALADTEMRGLQADAARVGIEATALAGIFTKAVAPAIRGSSTDVATTLANLRSETTQLAVLARELGIPYEQVESTLLQILNGHAQQRNQLVAILGLTQADLKAAKERNDIQGLLNSRLAAYKPQDASTNLRGIEGQFKESLERGAEDAVAPIVTVIEQKIGPAFSKLDLSGLTRAIQAITTQVGTVFGQMFDEAVKGAQALAGWLDQNRDKVQAVVADAVALASQVGTALGAAIKLAAAFVQVGLSSGIIGGAVRAMADLLTLAAKFAPEIAAAFAIEKIVGYTVALNKMTGAAIGVATRIGGFVTSLNAAGVAAGAAAVGVGATEAAAAGAVAPLTAAGVAAGVAAGGFLTLTVALTGIGLILAGIGLAWEVHRQNVARARAEQEAANQALGESIRLAPELIAQLATEEAAAKAATAGTTARKEAEEAVAATKAKLIALSPSYAGAINDETSSIEGQTAALQKLLAAQQEQAASQVRIAEQRVVDVESRLSQTQHAVDHPGEVGGGDEGALASTIPDLQEEKQKALDDLKKAQTALAPAAAPLPGQADVIKQMAADTAEVKRQHAAGLLDEKHYQDALAQIQFDGLEKQIAVRQKAMELESDPFRRKQEQDQITALRQQQAGTATFTRAPQEAAPGKGRKEDGQREADAAAQRSIIAEQMRLDKQDTEDLYKQKLLTAEQYYTKLAAIEYDGLQKEVAIDEQLLQTETDPKKRTELLAQITNLNAQALEATKHTTALEIEALDELQKKRIETARTSISDQATATRDTLSARVQDVHAEVDVGTITKAQGAQQLAAAYATALTNLRALIVAQARLAAQDQDPRDFAKLAELSKDFSQITLEAQKARDASNEFAKDLGDAFERSFDQMLGGGLDKMRSFSAAIREMALGIAKDLQRAFAQSLGKDIKAGVEHLLSTKPPAPPGDGTSFSPPAAARAVAAGSGAQLGAAGDQLSASAVEMKSAAALWAEVAAAFAKIGVPVGPNPFVAPASAGAQRGNATQSGAGASPPSSLALPGVATAPDLGTLGGDAGVPPITADVPGAGTPGGPLPGAPSPSGIAGSVLSVLGPLAGGHAPSAAGVISSVAPIAKDIIGGAPSGGGGAAAGGSAALAAAAAAIRSAASQLASSASQLGSAAQQLIQAASALSSAGGSAGGSGESGGGGGLIGSILGSTGGGGDAGAAAAAAQGGHVTQRGVLRLWRGGAAEAPADHSHRREMFSPALRAAAGMLALAAGGHVWGAGTATSDSIPAMLSKGEYVVNAASVSKVGVPAMHAINAGKFTRDSHNTIRHFASGGLVSGGGGNQARGSERHEVNINLAPGLVAEHMQSPAGRDAMVNVVTKNRSSMKAGLGIG
jgi:hypothetical protein